MNVYLHRFLIFGKIIFIVPILVYIHDPEIEKINNNVNASFTSFLGMFLHSMI